MEGVLVVSTLVMIEIGGIKQFGSTAIENVSMMHWCDAAGCEAELLPHPREFQDIIRKRESSFILTPGFSCYP